MALFPVVFCLRVSLMSGDDNCFNLVMPGLVPGIHVFKTALHARREVRP
jgi:hypothetical protein